MVEDIVAQLLGTGLWVQRCRFQNQTKSFCCMLETPYPHSATPHLGVDHWIPEDCEKKQKLKTCRGGWRETWNRLVFYPGR